MKIIHEPKYIRLLFWLCSLGYIAGLMGRVNYNAAMAEMISSGYITMAQAGMVLTGFFIAYAIGQPINGALCDRFSARLVLITGFFVSICANILLALTPPAAFVVWIWLINGFAQAMLWPAVVRLLSGYLSRLQSTQAMVSIMPTIACGTLLTYVIAAGVLSSFSWQLVFWIGALAMGIMGVTCFFGLGTVEKHSIAYGSVRVAEKKSVEKDSFLQIFFHAGLPIATIAIIMMGLLKDGVTTWAPSLLGAQFDLNYYWAVLITAAVPLLGIVGVYIAHMFNRYWLRNEILTSAVLFGIAAAAFGLMAVGVRGFAFAAALVFAVGLMHGINTMLISLVPLYFADKGRASTMGGVLNAFPYMGSGLSGIGVGVMAAGYGWRVVILAWFSAALIGLLSCLLSAKKWRKFTACH